MFSLGIDSENGVSYFIILEGCGICLIGQCHTDVRKEGVEEKKKTGITRVDIENVLTQHGVRV
jgi:hypothetical protein